jgi:hypothetical protein
MEGHALSSGMIVKAIRFVGWKALGLSRSFHLRAIRFFGGDRPVSLSYWIATNSRLNRFFRTKNSLFPTSGEPMPGGKVRVDDLRQVLSPYTIGGMRLDVYAIRFLWASLMRERPSVLVEFGSGISTLILASYARKSAVEWNRPVMVLSADQSKEFAAETASLLRKHSLDSYARVFEVPLNGNNTYEFAATAFVESIEEHGWDWLLIDGPFGPAGCRQQTLRDMAPFSRHNARWFLDDAYRDAELSILERWGTDSRFTVEGIVPTHSGLATGLVQGRKNSADHKGSCKAESISFQ